MSIFNSLNGFDNGRISLPALNKTAWLSSSALNPSGRIGGVVAPPTQAEFLDVRDGVSPVLQLDFNRNLFYFNSNYYTSYAAYIAGGGAPLGSGRIPIAALGSAPWTWQFTGVTPSTIGATRNYAFAWYGGTTNLSYLRLDQSTSNAQYTTINAGTTQASLTSPMGSLLGQPWIAAGVLGSNYAVFSSIGKDPGTPDTVLSLPAFNTGIALGYDPANSPNGKWLGTFGTFTVWPGNLGASAIRAIATGNKYGPSRVTMGGGGKSLNVGSYTYYSSVGTDGKQFLAKINNTTKEFVGLRAISSSPGEEDNHDVPAGVLTDNGGMAYAWTAHDTGNVFYFTSSSDTNMDNLAARSTLTLGGTLIPAYGTMRKRASNGNLFFFFRTNQTFWNYAISTDHGATWTHVGRFLDSSSFGGDKLLVSSIQEVSDGVFRCLANREPQYLDTEIRVFDINVDTLDIQSASGSVGTVGVGNGATMSSLGLMWDPGANLSVYTKSFKQWDQGVAGYIDETTNFRSYYWIKCTNPAAPFVSTSWSKTLICTNGKAGKSGDAHVISVDGLATPQVAISLYHADDDMYHLEIWEADDADGTSWHLKSTVATFDGTGDNALNAISSAPSANSNLPIQWLAGRDTLYNDYALQLYWQ